MLILKMYFIFYLQLRPINNQDVLLALPSVKPSLSSEDLKGYDEWNSQFGNMTKNS